MSPPQSSHTDKKKPPYQAARYLLAGGIAGAVSRTVVSPLERLKILYQVQPDVKYTSVWQSLKTIWVEEGMSGMFKGNGTNVIRIFPYSAVQFAAYEKYKKLLIPEGQSDLTPITRLIAGACAGVTSVVATYPLDLVRTRLSVQTADNIKYTSIANSFSVIVKEEGFMALFKGLSPTIMGVAPYVGLNFMFYETLKSVVKKAKEADCSTVELLAIGGAAGAIAQTLTYPLDVLRRKMQMQGFSEKFPGKSST
eukprot:TRINITY_DN5538_c0_g2_i2.p1 TRINITY_DN5538_c0_g2~~TRINITY_DN5538_c0_g2_i2.p1  ORF type:complete len:252 (-),score=43.37 TRINITY_DN5538_c0_g2_i2:857-1612(-)